MASPVEATMILCEHAVADPGSGKIHMLGAGWSVTTSPITAQAVAIMVSVPWDRANQKIHLTLALLDPDGRAIHLGPPGSGTDIRQEFQVEVGRPVGIPHGSPLDASLALNVPPLPLAAGRYEWRLEFDGQSLSRGFTVLRAGQSSVADAGARLQRQPGRSQPDLCGRAGSIRS